MKKEKIIINSLVHVYNRGNRRQPIVRDAKDKWHFIEMLYYFNDEFSTMNPFRDLQDGLRMVINKPFARPGGWPERKPLVKILSFSLLENHFHLLLKEIREGGITKFMRRIGTGIASHYNKKYQEVGRLFQGNYKAKIINKDEYLQYLSVYIQVKNILELYPGGYEKAISEFDKAYDWAIKYPYGSLADFADVRNSPIIDKDILGELFADAKEYKEFTRQCLGEINLKDKLGSLILEDW